MNLPHVEIPKVRLHFSTGSPAHRRYQNAPIARIPAGVGLNMRGPRHRTYQPMVAQGAAPVKGIRLTTMMPKAKPDTGYGSQFTPNPQKVAQKVNEEF
jgi:hypothetical protein